MLTLTNIQLTNAGSYSVTVTNQIGLTNSSEAMLSVVGLDHFAWSEIPSPRFVRAPFTVSILAQDTNNGTFTNFSGTVLLSSTNGGPVIPTVSGSFTQGSWSGAVKISQVTSNLVLQADDGAGHTGASYPIDVVNVPPLESLERRREIASLVARVAVGIYSGKLGQSPAGRLGASLIRSDIDQQPIYPVVSDDGDQSILPAAVPDRRTRFTNRERR